MGIYFLSLLTAILLLQMQIGEFISTSAIIINVIMGILSVPITNLFKKIPFINKFSGWIIPIINSLINVAIVYVLSLIFKISVFENPTDFQQVMTALGINVTVAQIFYEAIKPKTKV